MKNTILTTIINVIIFTTLSISNYFCNKNHTIIIVIIVIAGCHIQLCCKILLMIRMPVCLKPAMTLFGMVMLDGVNKQQWIWRDSNAVAMENGRGSTYYEHYMHCWKYKNQLDIKKMTPTIFVLNSYRTKERSSQVQVTCKESQVFDMRDLGGGNTQITKTVIPKIKKSDNCLKGDNLPFFLREYQYYPWECTS